MELSQKKYSNSSWLMINASQLSQIPKGLEQLLRSPRKWIPAGWWDSTVRPVLFANTLFFSWYLLVRFMWFPQAHESLPAAIETSSWDFSHKTDANCHWNPARCGMGWSWTDLGPSKLEPSDLEGNLFAVPKWMFWYVLFHGVSQCSILFSSCSFSFVFFQLFNRPWLFHPVWSSPSRCSLFTTSFPENYRPSWPDLNAPPVLISSQGQ